VARRRYEPHPATRHRNRANLFAVSRLEVSDDPSPAGGKLRPGDVPANITARLRTNGTQKAKRRSIDVERAYGPVPPGNDQTSAIVGDVDRRQPFMYTGPPRRRRYPAATALPAPNECADAVCATSIASHRPYFVTHDEDPILTLYGSRRPTQDECDEMAVGRSRRANDLAITGAKQEAPFTGLGGNGNDPARMRHGEDSSTRRG